MNEPDLVGIIEKKTTEYDQLRLQNYIKQKKSRNNAKCLCPWTRHFPQITVTNCPSFG